MSSSARILTTELDVSLPAVAKWRRGCPQRPLEGLTSRNHGRPFWKSTQLPVRLLTAILPRPQHRTGYWSCRQLAPGLGPTKNIVSPICQDTDLRPPYLARHMAFNDPVFRTKSPTSSVFTWPLRAPAAVLATDESDSYPGPPPPRPRAAALPGPSPATPIPVHAPRHAVAVCSAERTDPRGTGQDHGQARKPGLRRGSRGSDRRRESDHEIHVILAILGHPKNEAAAAVHQRTSKPDVALHAHVFVVADSRAALPLEGSGGVRSPRIFRSTNRLAAKAAPVHRRLHQACRPFSRKYANSTRHVYHGQLPSGEAR